MVTSRSSSGGDWTAGAFVFSGRPDPSWPISKDVAERLVAIWKGLLPTDAAPMTPALGYRGCSVRDPEGRTWLAYHELVTLSAEHGSETRLDDERRFEHIVLGSAPIGTLPGDSSAV